jgi:hypothetical protein
LPEAYHYLHYYSRAYGAPADASPKLLDNLRAAIRDLGGDPTLVRDDPISIGCGVSARRPSMPDVLAR